MSAARELDHKICLITAAASGMGRSSALRFCEEGAHVIAVDVDGHAGAALAKDVADAGGSLEFHQLDLTDLDGISNLVDIVGRDHGRLDVLFNHAGMPGTPGVEFDPQGWAKVVALNLTAPIALTGLATPLLTTSGNASVIFTSSIAGLVASPNSPTYSAAKAGVIGYMRAIAAALGPQGVRSNAVCPATTQTPMLQQFFAAGGDAISDEEVEEKIASFVINVPLGRIGRPEEVAEVALFLASDRSGFVTGVAIPVDGGYVAK